MDLIVAAVLLFVVIVVAGLLLRPDALSLLHKLIDLPSNEKFLLVVFIIATVFAVYASITYRQEKSDRKQVITYNFVIFSIIAGMVILCFVFVTSTNTPALVTTIAAGLATLGWATQRHQANQLSKKQYTLTLLLQYRQSELFHRHRLNTLSKYPGGKNISKEEADAILKEWKDGTKYDVTKHNELKYPFAESVFYILNFFEFIATGMLNGHFDEDLIKNTIGPAICSQYSKWQMFIEHPENLNITVVKQNGEPVATTFINLYQFTKKYGAQFS